MILKIKHDEEKNECVVYVDGDTEFKDVIKINIQNHQTEKIYDFFKKQLIKLLLGEEIELIESINCEEIKDKEFFKEDQFKELLCLLNQLKDTANNTIGKCFNSKGDE